MEYKDYYKILGLERGASKDDVKKAYRKLARKYHPDVSKEKDAEERFKEVGEAYDVLSDEKKREAYDRLGSNWQSGEQFTPPPGWQYAGAGGQEGGYSQVDPEAFGDFFSSLFGGGGAGFDFGRSQQHRAHRQAHPMRGEDVHARVNISLEEAYHGGTKELSLTQGDGTAFKTLRVKIPKGILPGQQIRLAGQGAPGHRGGPAGDLFIQVEYAPHHLFTVDKSDVYLKVPITPWEAALGASISAPTLGGRVDVKIPAGSQSGKKLRLKERGIPAKTPGDQYLLLEIMTPPAQNDEARALYEKMAATIPFNPRQDVRGWE